MDGRELPDGALVRSARDQADVDAAGALLADRGDDADAADLHLVAAQGDLTRIGVVERDGAVVATATLLDETVRVGSVVLPAGQVELLATAQGSEGRGYARALMERCHRLSQERGHALQVMIGIANFYRQFGYHYSVAMHPWGTARVPASTPSAATGVRAATPADLPRLTTLQDVAQSTFDVAMPHAGECWRWLLAHPSSTQWVVEDTDGELQGVARVMDDGEGGVDVAEVATRTGAATAELLRHAHRLAGPDGTVRVNDRPGTPGLGTLLHDHERADWYYVRIADPAALLGRLAPELHRRLLAAGSSDGEALLSFYRSHVRLRWDADRLEVTPGGPLQAPVSQGGSGVPPEALGSLVLGTGAATLEQHWPDAHLGRQPDLMVSLFPAQRADLLTFYLPA